MVLQAEKIIGSVIGSVFRCVFVLSLQFIFSSCFPLGSEDVVPASVMSFFPEDGAVTGLRFNSWVEFKDRPILENYSADLLWIESESGKIVEAVMRQDSVGNRVYLDFFRPLCPGRYCLKADFSGVCCEAKYASPETLSRFEVAGQGFAGFHYRAQEMISCSLSCSGKFLAAGSPRDTGTSGRVFVYKRSPDNSWAEMQQLVSPDETGRDSFGYSVSVYSDELSGLHEILVWGGNAGYVFEFSPISGKWEYTACLKSSNPWFQTNCVSICGDLAVVGAAGADISGVNQGACFVFRRDGSGSWKEYGVLYDSSGSRDDWFGFPALITPDYIFIGSVPRNRVYIYGRDLGRDSVLDSGLSCFGGSFDCDGKTLLVGAPGADSGKGCVCVYERSASGHWGLTDMIRDEGGLQGDSFGRFVSVQDDYALVSAPLSYEKRGSVFICGLSGSWQCLTEIINPEASPGDMYGLALDLVRDEGDVSLGIPPCFHAITGTNGPEEGISTSGRIDLYRF